MKYLCKHISVAIFLLVSFYEEAVAQKKTDPTTIKPINKPVANYKLKWSDTAVFYRAEFSGIIGQGKDDVRQIDSELKVFVVMNNGLVVSLSNNGSGVIINANDPAKKVFNLNIRGESGYVTDLNVRFVEIVHTKKGFRVNDAVSTLEEIRRANYAPDQWDFVQIKISAKLYKKNPVTNVETLIQQKEIINKRPMKKMTYGIWVSAAPPATFTPPQQVNDAAGRVAARILTGRDDMKSNPADAAILVQVPSGTLRYPLGRYTGLPAHSFWNYDGFSKIEEAVLWKSIGKAGIRFQYGDHGPFDRDDWEVKALLIDFFPDFLRGKEICFRKYSHYIPFNSEASLVRMNGDGAGTEKWSPFLSGR
ncbi:MAG TPA: hypothetical protein PLG08_16290 [Chitinophagaceae bacterium]|nr:hypothetical protein [Chitinophagaceae bacterium]